MDGIGRYILGGLITALLFFDIGFLRGCDANNHTVSGSVQTTKKIIFNNNNKTSDKEVLNINNKGIKATLSIYDIYAINNDNKVMERKRTVDYIIESYIPSYGIDLSINNFGLAVGMDYRVYNNYWIDYKHGIGNDFQEITATWRW